MRRAGTVGPGRALGDGRVLASLLVAATLGAAPAALPAQVNTDGTAPLRFGVAWARGAPQGEFSQVSAVPQGFAGWISMPLTRRSVIGLRAEFSVLTFPEDVISLPLDDGSTVTATVRGTVGFTGAGPRLEVAAGPLAFSGAAMGGYTRVITDVTGEVAGDDSVVKGANNYSDYAFAAKFSADAYLPVWRGVRGTALTLTGGLDYTTGGATAFPDRTSLGVTGDGDLVLERPTVRPTMVVVRGGLSVEF